MLSVLHGDISEGSIVGGAISHVRRVISFLGESGAAALVDYSFVFSNHVLAERGPHFSIGGRLPLSAFKRFVIKAAGIVEFDQCILNHGEVGKLLVVVFMGEEEHLDLLNASEYDLNWLGLFHGLIHAQEGLFNIIEDRLTI